MEVEIYISSFASGSKAPWKYRVISLCCKDIRIKIFEFKAGVQFFSQDNDLNQTRFFFPQFQPPVLAPKLVFFYLDIIYLGIRSFYQNFSDSLLSWVFLFFFNPCYTYLSWLILRGKLWGTCLIKVLKSIKFSLIHWGRVKV